MQSSMTSLLLQHRAWSMTTRNCRSMLATRLIQFPPLRISLLSDHWRAVKQYSNESRTTNASFCICFSLRMMDWSCLDRNLEMSWRLFNAMYVPYLLWLIPDHWQRTVQKAFREILPFEGKSRRSFQLHRGWHSANETQYPLAGGSQYWKKFNE